ncbi:MarR family winged helix-turn-helix transcriptional regulator [Ralstonia sp. 24A2]|uniref:MarR family winged helix-turn-helix transcriptional regulator n=1 Tax=Ralstonia sp. 24A2 TaxID=3447364 RepID=UPI003F69F93A
MSTAGFAFCMAVQRAHASLRLKLDDKLGTHYGIDFADFVLLDWLLSNADGHASLVECVQPLGLPRPAVLKRALALEKIGLVERQSAQEGRRIAIRPAGKTLVHNARETIGWLSGQALMAVEPASSASAEAALRTLADARILKVL